MSTPAAQQPAAPKKHKPAPRSPPPARLKPPPALPVDRGAPRAELRALLPAAPAPILAAAPDFTTPLRPSALSLPPNLQRARRRQTFGPRRVLFPET